MDTFGCGEDDANDGCVNEVQKEKERLKERTSRDTGWRFRKGRRRRASFVALLLFLIIHLADF